MGSDFPQMNIKDIDDLMRYIYQLNVYIECLKCENENMREEINKMYESRM
jgi:hypothetical protein